jgi:cytochrome P450
LWPVTVAASIRQLDRDVMFKNMCLPKNSIVHISNFSIQRSNISRPDDFIPDRWGPVSTVVNPIFDKSILQFRDQEIDVLNNQLLTFSLGKRSCVGQSMVTIEMKLILATVFRSFEFQKSTVETILPSLTSAGGADRDIKFEESDGHNGCRVGTPPIDYELFITIKPRNCFLKVVELKEK